MWFRHRLFEFLVTARNYLKVQSCTMFSWRSETITRWVRRRSLDRLITTDWFSLRSHLRWLQISQSWFFPTGNDLLHTERLGKWGQVHAIPSNWWNRDGSVRSQEVIFVKSINFLSCGWDSTMKRKSQYKFCFFDQLSEAESQRWISVSRIGIFPNFVTLTWLVLARVGQCYAHACQGLRAGGQQQDRQDGSLQTAVQANGYEKMQTR